MNFISGSENEKVHKTVAIIGGGHNGLTCAAYLSRAGFKVNLFEKRDLLGGLCVTEKPFVQAPEIKVSSVASYYGMLRAEVVAELELQEHGLKPYLTDPIEVVLLDKGEYVFTPRDGGEAKTKIEGLDEKEKEGWHKFWQDIQKAAALVYPHYLKPGLTQAGLISLLRENDLNTLADNLFAGSLFDLLSHYVDNNGLKSVAATCTPGFAGNPGSVFGCIHHGTASTCNEFGAWGQVFSGMGEITIALTDVALKNGARLHIDRPVQSLLIDGSKISGLKFEDGSEEIFDIVICSADPYVLFEKLMPEAIDPQVKPDLLKIKNALSANRPKVSAAKLHFLLSGLPSIKTLTEIGHNHKGVIVIAPSKEAVEKAGEKVPAGEMPTELMLTMAFPTLEDPSMLGKDLEEKQEIDTPDKRHVLTVDVHYLPARINGQDWTAHDDGRLLEQTIRTIETQCPDFRKYILESFVVSPRALSERFNLASLSCWHLPMTSEHLFERRALPGCKHYETPIENLYVCSAGTYPGGNVTAAPGHNLAKLLIEKYQYDESNQASGARPLAQVSAQSSGKKQVGTK